MAFISHEIVERIKKEKIRKMFIENACQLPQKPSGAKAFYLINFMFSEKFGLLVKLFSSVSSVFFIAVKLKNVSFMYSPRPYDKKNRFRYQCKTQHKKGGAGKRNFIYQIKREIGNNENGFFMLVHCRPLY